VYGLYVADEVRLFAQHLAANEALGFAQVHGKVARAVHLARERFVARAAMVFAVFLNDFQVIIVGPNVAHANVPFQLLLGAKALIANGTGCFREVRRQVLRASNFVGEFVPARTAFERSPRRRYDPEAVLAAARGGFAIIKFCKTTRPDRQ